MEKITGGMSKTFWQNRRTIIVIHEATTGLAYDLRDYLLKQSVQELLFISHPLIYLKENLKKSSKYELYRRGKLIKSKRAFHWILPEPFLYLKDFFYTIFWCLRTGGKYNIFFGVDNLNAFSGCVLRFLTRVDRVIYYVIDYVPQRFSNKLLNDIYHRIEKFCAKYCDWTWNLSPRMIEARRKKWHMDFPHQLVVWHGVNFARIKRVPFENINETEILYMGTLLKKQGVQLVIESLPFIIKKAPKVRLTIIGKGPYERELKKLVDKLSLEKYVDFLGYIPSHQEVENRIARAAITIALYDRKHDDFSYYSDPGKIKTYLGAGVPVVMTDVPYVAREVEKARCGFIVQYKRDELVETLVKFLLNKKLMKSYRINALNFAKKYDWDSVFAKALAPLTASYNAK